MSKKTDSGFIPLDTIVSLRQKIWEKRNEFARSNYGEYPNSLIVSSDVNAELLKELMARQELINTGKYMGMELSVLFDYRKEKTIRVAKVTS